jgi:putative FmdB family regulatory protein
MTLIRKILPVRIPILNYCQIPWAKLLNFYPFLIFLQAIIFKEQMPTYEYVCTDCGHTFDHFQTILSVPLDICPECSGQLKRKIGAGLSPIFKGSGFYQTDYKPSKKEPAKPKDSPAADTKPAATEGNTEKSKPESKPDKPTGGEIKS